jgi:hypothetical protein
VRATPLVLAFGAVLMGRRGRKESMMSSKAQVTRLKKSESKTFKKYQLT